MLWYRGRRASARHSGCAPFRLRSDAGRRSSRRLALRRCERRASSDQGHSHARVHSMPLPGNVLDRASHLPGGRFDSRERRRALAAECVSRARVRRACLDRLHLRAHAGLEAASVGQNSKCCLFALDSITSTPIPYTLTRLRDAEEGLGRIANSRVHLVWPGQSLASFCTFGKVLHCFRFQFPDSKTLDPLAHTHMSASIVHEDGLRTWENFRT